ncbi:MAG: hypothetical protein AMXMBFR53_26540 [Gemmatimonadota bacterium]
MSGAGTPEGTYTARIAACDAALEGLRGRSARLSTLRVATFLSAATALLLVDVTEGFVARVALAAAALGAIGFATYVAAHRRVRREIAWQEALRALARQGLLRLARKWADLEAALPRAEARHEATPADHPYARDLDVVGTASLARLAGPVTSERGRARLRRSLLEPAPPATIRARQEAVRELAPKVDLRHAFAAHGRLHGAADPPGTGRFLAWAEGRPRLLGMPWVRALAWVLPTALVGGLVADLFFGAPPYWLAPALAQAELLRRHWRRLHADFLLAEDGLALLAAYVPQLRLLEDEPAEAPALQALAHRVGRGAEGASRRLQRLARLLGTVESRRSLVYLAVAPVLLLDVHLAAALDRWRGAAGPRVRDWLEALGEWESLSALAAVAHDHPAWTFPVVEEGGEARLRGTALGHPLLPPGTCVANDVEVGPPGSFLLVTGSNMSGKSTLLRALGANVVLACAGAPACAGALRFPPVRVRTSMRVDDSLAEGVSLFMAELLRIRQVVEDAEAAGPPVLYLLDEILHGTNTAERRVAARAVVRHLLRRDAIGAVSTHDLTLAEAVDLESASRPVHFRETVGEVDGRTRLDFDYRLRPGLATTRNALKLLDAVGLGGLVDDEAVAGGADA